jgi:hypothetical protein
MVMTPDIFEVEELRSATFEDALETSDDDFAVRSDREDLDGFQIQFDDQPDTFAELRQSFDGNESFMLGHQIGKARRIRRPCPDWMRNDALVQAFLTKRFPRLETDVRQRQTGALWTLVIARYFRDNQADAQIAVDLNGGYSAEKPKRKKLIKPDVTRTDQAYWDKVLKDHGVGVRNVVPDGFKANKGRKKFVAADIRRIALAILRTYEGKRTDGKPRTTGKAGRPRKSTRTLQTSVAETIGDSVNCPKPSSDCLVAN